MREPRGEADENDRSKYPGEVLSDGGEGQLLEQPYPRWRPTNMNLVLDV